MKSRMKMALILGMIIVLIVGLVAAWGVVLAVPPSQQVEVKGVISGIEKTAPSTVTITPQKGAPVKLNVETSTIITKAGLGQATLDDLAINDRAVAIYNIDTLLASKITVSGPLAKHHSFTGTIKNMAPSSFVLTTKKQGEVTISLNGNTGYKVPGVKNATLADLKVGHKVAVLADEVNGSNAALHVVMIPGKPLFVQRVGTIQAYTAGQSITLQDKNGELYTFMVTSDTKTVFKKGATEVTIGESATVVARRDPATDQFTATAILVFGSKQSPSKS